jgi:two-component system NtrC family sensor kinase
LGVLETAAQTIAEGSKRINTTVTRLRSFARLDEASVKDLDLKICIEDVMAILVRPETVSFRSDLESVPLLRCYPLEVNQLVMSVLANAFDAVGDEGCVTVRGSSDTKEVVLVVEDDGCGIADADLPHIFDPGFTTKGVGVGAGLGLAVASQVARRHGGELAVTSKLREGTQVTLRFPLSGPPDARAGA